MKEGDRVVCIDASMGKIGIMPLIKGREYIIYNISKCTCGGIGIDVGFLRSMFNLICFCSKPLLNCTESHWFKPERFAKVQEEYRVVHMEVEIEEPILN